MPNPKSGNLDRLMRFFRKRSDSSEEELKNFFKNEHDALLKEMERLFKCEDGGLSTAKSRLPPQVTPMATQTDPAIPCREAETQTDLCTLTYCNASTQTDWQEERQDEGRRNHGVPAQMGLEMAACQMVGPQHLGFGHGMPGGPEMAQKMGEFEDPSGDKPKKLSRGDGPTDDPESASMSDGPKEDPESQDDHREEPTKLGDEESHSSQASDAELDPPSKIRWEPIKTLSIRIPWRGRHIPVVLPPPPGFFREVPTRLLVVCRETTSREPLSRETYESWDSRICSLEKKKFRRIVREKGQANSLSKMKPEWAVPSPMFWGVPTSVSEAAGKEKFEVPVFSESTSTGRLTDCFVFEGA
jgi:hypothetical protein